MYCPKCWRFYNRQPLSRELRSQSEKTWAIDQTNASRRNYFGGKKLRPSEWVFFRRRAGKRGKV
jgi:hypothetical protein